MSIKPRVKKNKKSKRAQFDERNPDASANEPPSKHLKTGGD